MFRHTFFDADGGGGVFAAAGAPLMDLFGGGSVGDAVAAVLVESVPLTGAYVVIRSLILGKVGIFPFI